MMESLLANILTPENAKSVLIVVVGLFAKDFAVGMLRRLAKRFRTDKDPGNDVVADVADQVADSLAAVRIPSGKK